MADSDGGFRWRIVCVCVCVRARARLAASKSVAVRMGCGISLACPSQIVLVRPARRKVDGVILNSSVDASKEKLENPGLFTPTAGLHSPIWLQLNITDTERSRAKEVTEPRNVKVVMGVRSVSSGKADMPATLQPYGFRQRKFFL